MPDAGLPHHARTRSGRTDRQPGLRLPYPAPRASPGERTILTPRAALVVLNRLQSGIGVLNFSAATSEAVGDLRLGCAYQLRTGHSSVLAHTGASATTAPADSRSPLISARRDSFERIAVDLRHSAEFERFIVFGFSATGQVLNWGGTLVITPAGDGRIELPLQRPPTGGVTVLTSLHNIDGELFLRAEMEVISGSIKDACQAYGFDRITWLDDSTALE